MRKFPQKFTRNKQVVRDLQGETITKFFASGLGRLRYFGLPSSSLDDVIQWAAFLESITAVERGERDKEWELQHDVEFQAFKSGLFDKLTLLRGDIDEILINGKDGLGAAVAFPFDIVSLDYSGGLFYVIEGEMKRLKAIDAAFEHQSVFRRNFVFFLSCNLDAIHGGEISNAFASIRTSLTRKGSNGDEVISAILKHPMHEARLKVYVPYAINRFASKWHYQCETQDVIFYSGNLKTRMMAFRFHVKYDPRTATPVEPRERLNQIINSPLIEIVDGKQRFNTLDLPKVRLSA
jgi:hypothetical protein